MLVHGTVGHPKDYPTVHRTASWDRISSVGGTVGRPRDYPTVHWTVGWDVYYFLSRTEGNF